MERYDYEQAVYNDVQAWVEEHIDEMIDKFDEPDVRCQEWVEEQCWISDSVTGNGSGSYTFNTWQAEENLCHNFELLGECLEEFGVSSSEALEKGAEYCDVTIRCALPSSAIVDYFDSDEFEELWESKHKEMEED